MADARRFELEDLLIRPGTYFNPKTEVLIVVDDSPEIDHEIFDADAPEDAEWVLVSDESPLDESLRDELVERFQAAMRRRSEVAFEGELDEEGNEEDELDADEDEELDGE